MKMKRKQILITVAVLLLACILITISRSHSDRHARIEEYQSRITALTDVHGHITQTGPEFARLYTEMMILGNTRGLDELLSHPFAPWWPPRTRGSYERIPFWRIPHRKERLEKLRAFRTEFGVSIGATNRQEENEIYKRMVEIKQGKPTNASTTTNQSALGAD